MLIFIAESQNMVNQQIFLADDDADDCMLFEDALKEVCSDTTLTTASDGQELMEILNETVPPPPRIIFLDLNMPRKNGFECLDEIKRTTKLKSIPIVIFSTSAQPEAINRAYRQGANFFINKPRSFPLLKKAISDVLAIEWDGIKSQPPMDEFLLFYS